MGSVKFDHARFHTLSRECLILAGELIRQGKQRAGQILAMVGKGQADDIVALILRGEVRTAMESKL